MSLDLTPLAKLLIECLSRRGVVVPPTGDLEIAGSTALVATIWDGFREFGELPVDGLYPGLSVLGRGREETDTLVLETSQAVSGARIPIMNRPPMASLARRLYLVDESGAWRENQEMTITFIFSADSPSGLFEDRESRYAAGGPDGQADAWAQAVAASRFGESLRNPLTIETAQFRATG